MLGSTGGVGWPRSYAGCSHPAIRQTIQQATRGAIQQVTREAKGRGGISGIRAGDVYFTCPIAHTMIFEDHVLPEERYIMTLRTRIKRLNIETW